MYKMLGTVLFRAAWSAIKSSWNWVKCTYERYRLRIAEERLRYQRLREEREGECFAAEEAITQAGDAVMEGMHNAQTTGDKLANLAGHTVDYGDRPVPGRLRVNAAPRRRCACR